MDLARQAQTRPLRSCPGTARWGRELLGAHSHAMAFARRASQMRLHADPLARVFELSSWLQLLHECVQASSLTLWAHPPHHFSGVLASAGLVISIFEEHFDAFTSVIVPQAERGELQDEATIDAQVEACVLGDALADRRRFGA